MKQEMTRLEMLWLFATIAGCLTSSSIHSTVASFFAVSLVFISFMALMVMRCNKSVRERRDIEAKYAAQDAELLKQANKHHG